MKLLAKERTRLTLIAKEERTRLKLIAIKGHDRLKLLANAEEARFKLQDGLIWPSVGLLRRSQECRSEN